MTSGTENRNSHVHLVQYNKQLQTLLSQMKQKTELYELGLGNISKILTDLPNELQFKVLTSSDRLRSSFSLTTHLLMQKKALDRIEKVVEEVQGSVAYKGIFAGLAASTNTTNKKTTASSKISTGVQVNTQPSIIVATTRAITEPQTSTPTTSTLSIQKSLIKPMPPAPPPPSITKHTVTPAVVHKLGSDTKEIQIQIEANPIDTRAFFEKDIIFRGATIRSIGKYPKMDYDHNNMFMHRTGRGRPPTRIPSYSTKVLRDPRRFPPRRPEEQYPNKELGEIGHEEDMAWQCLERVYASHRIVKEKHFASGGSFNISQILENAPIAFSNAENDDDPSLSSRPHSVSPNAGKINES